MTGSNLDTNELSACGWQLATETVQRGHAGSARFGNEATSGRFLSIGSCMQKTSARRDAWLNFGSDQRKTLKQHEMVLNIE
jgi:hypothetical protein